MTITEKHCRCNGTGAIGHGGSSADPDSLEICSCPPRPLLPPLPKAPHAPGFYVSVIDGPRRALVDGPYATHAEALERVDPVRDAWVEENGRAWFYAWGTARVH